jgi:dihydrofolate synthase/folylpolyglutamate synthase
MSYQSALDFLFPRTTQIKFGLDTTRVLLAAVGNPQDQLPSIHIAGTNGKGSVSTLMAGALQLQGLRVGLYTSPHLMSFRERIQVDGVPISEDAVATWTATLRPTIDALDATFFEATTAIAFAHFAARHVDIAVVEVGLGGRLDSTNVIEPLVSVITHIALDHQKYLGDTIDEIAAEKAGIAKPGVPLVIGEPDPEIAALVEHAARAVVESASIDARGFCPVVVPSNERWTGPLRLAGRHQRRNAAVAHAALQQLPEPLRPGRAEVDRAFRTAHVPGRFDHRGKWLFDVAHNPDSMRALVDTLHGVPQPRPIHALVSILGDKAWPEMLVALDAVIDFGILTVAPSADSRRWDLEWLERWLRDPARPPARAQWHLEPEFPRALREVQEGAATVLVTGSFHTVGDVMGALELDA